MSFLFGHPAEVAARLAEHVELTALSLAIALAIALPLGVAVHRNRRLGTPVLAVLGVLYTVPSLALFALLVPWLGLGTPTAVVGLVAYAQMILVRNVAAGLASVPGAQVDAARGLGMSAWQRLRRIEFPQALPVILGGVRIATVSLIAIANVAAWINAGGLGTLIFDGIHQDDPPKIVAGSLASAALAIVADLVLRALERRASWRDAQVGGSPTTRSKATRKRRSASLQDRS